MGFRKEVRDRLSKIEFLLEQIQKNLLSHRTAEILRLEKQNKDLFDRFQATKWADYIDKNPERWEQNEQPLVGTESPLSDESLIGTVVDDAEFTK